MVGHYSDRLVSNNTCIECTRQKKEHARQVNPDYMRNYRAVNAAAIAASGKLWRTNNSARVKRNQQRWKQRNRSLATAQENLRRANKLKATPNWSEHEAIKEMYSCASVRTQTTGQQWDVDHIVPLKSSRVCGLHVLSNLQLLPHLENVTKGNRLQPFL